MITYWFYPEQVPRAFRSYELYKYFCSKGYEVEVISIKNKKIYKSVDKLEDDGQEKKQYSNSKFKNSFKKTKLFKWLFNVLLFFIGELPFLTHRNYLRKQLSEEYLSKFDKIMVISLPFFSAYYTSRAITKFHWSGISILDMGDPFFGHQLKRARYFNVLQKKTLKTFDYISVPIREVVPYYTDYIQEEKIKIVPQAFNFLDTEINEYHKNKVPTFAYAGTFYDDIRNPTSFFEYLITIDENFLFILYTRKDTKIYEEIVKPFEERLNGKLIVNDVVPRVELLKKLSEMDFLISFENTSNLQSPSKLIDYGLTGRPVLSINNNGEDFHQIYEFFNEQYKHKMDIDISKYDINLVGEVFIELLEGDINVK